MPRGGFRQAICGHSYALQLSLDAMAPSCLCSSAFRQAWPVEGLGCQCLASGPGRSGQSYPDISLMFVMVGKVSGSRDVCFRPRVLVRNSSGFVGCENTGSSSLPGCVVCAGWASWWLKWSPWPHPENIPQTCKVRVSICLSCPGAQPLPAKT